jgi:retron-type reverse transcriptase
MNKKQYEQQHITKRRDYLRKQSLPLIQLRMRNEDTKHINHKIYHLLCDPFIYVNAYAKISKNPGALTKGIKSDEEIMTFFGKSNAEKIANKFKTKNYSWKPTRRTWIPKPGKNKLRPIDTPTQEDRIVQEAIRGILESIFEPEFREFETQNEFLCTNYGFRPNQSTWKAANALKIFGQATIYGIEGHISGAYNNVDHDILINLLNKRIKDKKFIEVISKLLKSDIMEENK